MSSAAATSSTFHLEWNNHLDNMQALLESLYCHQSLVDVTVACCDGILKAHKVILSACSPYFESIFLETPCKHPVLILKGVSVREMQALLRFMYCGQVDVPEADLACLVATACEFKVKGFAMDVMKNVDSHLHNRVEEEVGNEIDALSDRVPSTTSQNWMSLENDVSEPSEEKQIEESHEDEKGPVIVGTVSEAQSAGDEEEEEEEVIIPTPMELTASLKASPLGQMEATAGTSGVTSSSNQASATSTNNCGTNSSVSNGEAAPFRRETRFKGQKRVDVGIRPTAGRIRSSDKRESSSSSLDSRLSQTAGPLAKKQRTSVSSTSGERKKQDLTGGTETPTPSVSEGMSKPGTPEPHASVGGTTTDNSAGVGGEKVLDMSIKAEAESAEDEDDEEEATADMFCIPHLQESPDPEPEPGTSDTSSWRNVSGSSISGSSASGRELRANADVPAGEGEGDMACPYCFERYSRISDLQRHMRLHTEDKPHECEFCSLAFARASHLARHRRTHTGERPFRCTAPACGRTFSRQDKLKLHTVRSHPELPRATTSGGNCLRHRGRRRLRDKSIPLGLHLGLASPTSTSGTVASSTTSTAASTAPLSAAPALISLPFGDTSYLTSLSIGQQRYSDLTISPVTGGSALSSGVVGPGGPVAPAGAEELLKSVRQLGECTIQTLPGKVLAE